MLTTVQDWPGRIGYWHVGVPPSGPMDDLSFRIGNRVLGNPQGTAGLECTRAGPALAFPDGGRVCVTGAPVAVTLDGVPVPQWQSVTVRGRRSARRRDAHRPGNALLRVGGPAACRNSNTWAARPPSRLARSAVTAAGHCVKAMLLTAGAEPWAGARPTRTRGDRRAAQHRAPLGDRGDRRSAGRTGILHPRRYRHAGRNRLHRALQFRSHRCAACLGPKPEWGAQRRRRGRTASIEHSRQRLLRRHFGLHRRHPDPARP